MGFFLFFEDVFLSQEYVLINWSLLFAFLEVLAIWSEDMDVALRLCIVEFGGCSTAAKLSHHAAGIDAHCLSGKVHATVEWVDAAGFVTRRSTYK